MPSILLWLLQYVQLKKDKSDISWARLSKNYESYFSYFKKCTISENVVFEKWNFITSLELNQIISQRMTRQIKSFHNEWRGKSIIYNFINEWRGEAESWVYEIINDWFAKSRVMKGFRFAKSWVVNWFDLTKDEWWYFISQKSHFQK